MTSDAERFAETFDVSRETSKRLEIYASLIEKWNRTINLVAPSTLSEIWTRHFTDSAELFSLANQHKGRWVDMGSGGGFPGLVIAIVAAEKAPSLQVTCIESDLRKCEFMRTVCRATEVTVGILTRRIEDAPPQSADIISARALAPLSRLLPYAQRHLAPGGRAIFSKGRNWQSEIDEALASWRFSVENHPSLTDPESRILVIGDIVRA